MDLPYSIKRGEVLAVPVLIFNYMKTKQSVMVTLKASRSFELASKNGKHTSNTKRVSISAGKSDVVYYLIRPRVIGRLQLTVKARTRSIADGVRRHLLVEPEGITVYKNQPFIIDLRKRQFFEQSVKMNMPKDVIQGSELAEFSVIGDILGPMLNNIENLVRMPSGCGEQNMIKFVPNILVRKYLRATGRLVPEIRSKTDIFIKTGYQTQLNYWRADGSFSAYGKRDKEGSTWLTAFVLWFFNEAKPFTLIDQNVLKQAANFIKRRQESSGAFVEKGTVFQKEMQGGSSQSRVALTAYVLIALVKNGEGNRRASKLLEKNLAQLSQKPYELSIVAYALQLVGSRKRTLAWRMLLKLASREDGMIYWQETTHLKSKGHDAITPKAIEMTSYALLNYVARKKASNALPIVRWLTSQRNSNGGFLSTQDTVVGLSALEAFAEQTYSTETDLKVTTLQSGGRTETTRINNHNSVVLKKTELSPQLSKSVTIRATGSGTAFAQVAWQYNVPKLKEQSPFRCNKTVTDLGNGLIYVDFCCRYVKEGGSNMVLAKVLSPSGYTIDEEELESLPLKTEIIQRTETERGGTQANIYTNSIGYAPICAQITLQRIFMVDSPKAFTITVFDYYEPEDMTVLEVPFDEPVRLEKICKHCWDY